MPGSVVGHIGFAEESVITGLSMKEDTSGFNAGFIKVILPHAIYQSANLFLHQLKIAWFGAGFLVAGCDEDQDNNQTEGEDSFHNCTISFGIHVFPY
jgi:hypothetical protein